MQAQSVSGQVTDDSGLPLIGASILEKGTPNGTVTDPDGKFSINLSKIPTTLVVSYIGYTTNEVGVESASSDLKIMLSEGAQLDEVVVTALGIERSKKNLTYSVQELEGDDVRVTRDPNFVNTLNGKVAGLVVTTNASGLVVLQGLFSVAIVPFLARIMH
ncbi:MAG: carboxypeptidase-like regulatory domain-containing protein [Saprospiraceae bacterium]